MNKITSVSISVEGDDMFGNRYGDTPRRGATPGRMHYTLHLEAILDERGVARIQEFINGVKAEEEYGEPQLEEPEPRRLPETVVRALPVTIVRKLPAKRKP